MKKLKIANIDNYIYTLIDEDEHKYILNLEILDIEEKPKKEEVIYMHKELLNPEYEGYSTSYTFGDIHSQYGKENILMDDIDVIKLVLDEKEIYLKRLYG